MSTKRYVNAYVPTYLPRYNIIWFWSLYKNQSCDYESLIQKNLQQKK
jgi:hypothetical protein